MNYLFLIPIFLLIALVVVQAMRIKKFEKQNNERNILLINLEHEKDYYKDICKKYEDVLGKAIKAGEDSPDGKKGINKSKK